MLKTLYKFFILALFSLSSSVVLANNVCYIIITKNPKWSNYDVHITLHDFLTQTPIMNFTLPRVNPLHPNSTLNTVSATFDCTRYQQIQLFASFSPAIWQNQKDTLFPSKDVWNIAQQVQSLKPGQNQVELAIRFPEDFSGIPELINPKLFQ